MTTEMSIQDSFTDRGKSSSKLDKYYNSVQIPAKNVNNIDLSPGNSDDEDGNDRDLD